MSGRGFETLNNEILHYWFKFTSWKAKIILVLIITPCSQIYASPYLNIKTSLGDFSIELFEQTAPITVNNFLTYVESKRYDGTVIHRSLPNFVVQGGWLSYNESTNSLNEIVLEETIRNEYNISNIRGTMAMAKLAGDPDSASSQWFINLNDNSANLNVQNGGFTVFGRVVGDGMNIVDEIAALDTYVLNTNTLGRLSDFPLANLSGDISSDNFVTISSASRITEITEPNYYHEKSKELRIQVNAGGSDVYSLAFSIEKSVPDVVFKLELSSMHVLAKKEEKTAVYTSSSGLLLVPELYVGGIVAFRNLELRLIDPVRFLFKLESFERL
jgi:peptidyl-prolyl cis-trans isomerase A (cyclophilin A)